MQPLGPLSQEMLVGSGVRCKVLYLWCCPLDGDLATVGDIVLLILEVTRQPKVSNLERAVMAQHTLAGVSQGMLLGCLSGTPA